MDLSSVGGVSSSSSPAGKKRDVFDEIRQAAIKRFSVLEVSETEINRHLATLLAARMQPSLEGWVRFDQIAVDLEADVAHLTMVWDIRGYRRTATVDLRLTRLEKTFRVEVVGGAYGHLQVPRGLARPLTPILRNLASAFEPEIQSLFQMNQIQIAKDKLVLDPRF